MCKYLNNINILRILKLFFYYGYKAFMASIMTTTAYLLKYSEIVNEE